MKIANTMRQHIYKYESLYAILCGSLLIVGGGYSLISRIGGDYPYPGIGYMLMGISFITSIYLKRKWLGICAFLTMLLAIWIMIFKPFSNLGDDNARKEVGVQQQAGRKLQSLTILRTIHDGNLSYLSFVQRLGVNAEQVL